MPEAVKKTAEKGIRRSKRTEFTPARDLLAEGIEIIPDIMNHTETAEVNTLEGRIGPLLLVDGMHTHFIDMPSGMYCAEHPHAKGSIIYTARGKWVLCSEGERILMDTGSLFFFQANIPTGYEVPFDEDAYLLVFGEGKMESEQKFIDYLGGMAKRLEKKQKEGEPFLLKDLPDDHAALEFARNINPSYFA